MVFGNTKTSIANLVTFILTVIFLMVVTVEILYCNLIRGREEICYSLRYGISNIYPQLLFN